MVNYVEITQSFNNSLIIKALYFLDMCLRWLIRQAFSNLITKIINYSTCIAWRDSCQFLVSCYYLTHLPFSKQDYTANYSGQMDNQEEQESSIFIVNFPSHGNLNPSCCI